MYQLCGHRRPRARKQLTSALPIRTSRMPATYLFPLLFSCFKLNALLLTVDKPLNAALALAPPALKRPKTLEEAEVVAVEEVETETLELVGTGDSSRS